MNVTTGVLGLLLVFGSGCSTPKAVKSLSTTTRNGAHEILDAYAHDLENVANYLSNERDAITAIVAEAHAANERTNQVITTWKDTVDLAFRRRVLAQWDDRIAQLLEKDFPEAVTKVYWPRINERLQPLSQDLKTKNALANGANGNNTLALEAALSGAKVAELQHQAADALIIVYDELHTAVAVERRSLLAVLKLSDGGESIPTLNFGAKKPDTAALDKSLMEVSDAIQAQHSAVIAVQSALDGALLGVDQYLQNDGYWRMFAKDAVKGFVNGLKGQLDVTNVVKNAGDLVGKLKIPELTNAVTTLTNDAASKAAQSASEYLQKHLDGLVDKGRDSANKLVDSLVTRFDKAAAQVDRKTK